MATEPDATTSPEPETTDDADAMFDDEDGPADVQLIKLDERLDAALGDLSAQNKQVESYLEFLAEERRKAMQGTAADQLTLDDAAADAEEAGTPPTDSATAEQ